MAPLLYFACMRTVCVASCSLENVQRVQRVKRKIEQRKALLAQAELRETRTRRKTHKPDYVYSNGFESQASAEVSVDISGSSLNGLKLRMMPMMVITKRTRTMDSMTTISSILLSTVLNRKGTVIFHLSLAGVPHEKS